MSTFMFCILFSLRLSVEPELNKQVTNRNVRKINLSNIYISQVWLKCGKYQDLP